MGAGSLTTIKSLLAPMTRISVVLSGTEGTGNDAFSFLKSNSGSFELSFISVWYLQDSDADVMSFLERNHNDNLMKNFDLGKVVRKRTTEGETRAYSNQNEEKINMSTIIITWMLLQKLSHRLPLLLRSLL